MYNRLVLNSEICLSLLLHTGIKSMDYHVWTFLVLVLFFIFLEGGGQCLAV